MSFADTRNTRRFSCSHSNSGFTLIELLVVVGVIAVLAAITFGVTRGVQSAQARAQVKGELVSLAQALEQFKVTHGDYPWVNDDPRELSKALLGWKKFVRVNGATTFQDKAANEVPSGGPKAFVDPTTLDYSGTLPATVTTLPTNIEFLDPWGNPYQYRYKEASTQNSWEVFGYHLYSLGPDGVEDTAEFSDNTGVMSRIYRDADENIDNIFIGE